MIFLVYLRYLVFGKKLGKKKITNEVRSQIIGFFKKTKSKKEITRLVWESEKCVKKMIPLRLQRVNHSWEAKKSDL